MQIANNYEELKFETKKLQWQSDGS